MVSYYRILDTLFLHNIMPGFTSHTSKSVLCNTDTSPSLSQEEISQKYEKKTAEMNEAVWYAREQLVRYIMQRFDRSTSEGSSLESSLKDKWQHCVATSVHSKNKQPQLYCKLDLSKDIGTKNLLEYYDGPIPTKYDKATQKETPITLIPRSIISYVNKNDSNDRPGKVFRDHINSVWLPEGLEIRIYPAKDINGNRVNWVYNCTIQREMNSSNCAWDNDFEIFSDSD